MQQWRMKYHSETLNQRNTKIVQHVVVQYYNSTIVNSATITIAIATSEQHLVQ